MSGDSCLVPDLPRELCQLRSPGTSFSDKGRRRSISLRPKPDEVCQILEVDRHEFRQHYQHQDKKLCDAMVLYQKGQARRLVLVELKGGNTDDAYVQMVASAQFIRTRLPPSLRGIEVVAVVACKSSPSNNKALCAKFKREHGFTLVFKSCERLDLRDFLTD